MFKFGCAVMLGLLLGAAGFWYYTQNRERIASVPARVESAMTEAKETLRDQFNADEMKAELARTGAIVREKARRAGASLSEAAANAKITATIKARLLADSELPGLHIGVDTTDGVVTLSGKVSSAQQMSKAVKLAFETEGVHKVFSTLQVVADARPESNP